MTAPRERTAKQRRQPYQRGEYQIRPPQFTFRYSVGGPPEVANIPIEHCASEESRRAYVDAFMREKLGLE